MIKLIRIEQLKPGMYIHDLNCAWRDHDFLLNHVAVDSDATIEKVRRTGVSEVYIDTSRGLDVAPQPADTPLGRTDTVPPRPAPTPAAAPMRTTVADEAPAARRLCDEAKNLVRALLAEVRLGRHVELERVAPVVAGIVDSILRQPDALLPLARVRDHDEYTFVHSVSACALIACFGRTLALPRETLCELATGALLHDIGKAQVPGRILNKPAKLSDDEFEQMKSHVVQSRIVLQETAGISATALDVVAQHHERFDGTGYPDRLAGDAISLYGRMAAIVDVYDALTSTRVYRKAIAPTEALRLLLHGSGTHFDPKLVHAFVRSVGIYPAGSLVRLASERLAVVHQQNGASLLRPLVWVMYDIAADRELEPALLDLLDSDDRIVADDDWANWHLDPRRWLPA